MEECLMSLFDSFPDTPGQIKIEGETIVVSFAQGLPTDGLGTVSWNIPVPAKGCSAADGIGAYAGIVALLSYQPLTRDNAPVDGTFYDADPTADPDIHLGDKIGSAAVIGAFYEVNQRSRGEDLTTSFVVSDLKPNTPYYVAVYAVDAQGRYHAEGIRAYSDELTCDNNPDTSSWQVIEMGDGILPTDGTSLVPGLIYEFDIDLDTAFTTGTQRNTTRFSVDGANISTYQALIDEMNKTFALAQNPPQSSVPLNSGRFVVIDNVVYQWDGTTHTNINAIIELTDPATPITGDYWYDPSLNVLQRWDTPAAGIWNVVSVLSYSTDPTTPAGGDDFWFNGTNAYSWCSTTWCDEVLHNQEADPSLQPKPTDCGNYWYDEANSQLMEYNIETCQWEPVFAIEWDIAPNAIFDGTYWFDDTTSDLYVRTAGSPSTWVQIPLFGTGSPIVQPTLVIFETEPTDLTAGIHWYNPLTEELAISDGVVYVPTPLLIWPEDPTLTESCDLWWNTDDDNLYKWDIVHSEWDLVSSFVQSDIDPNTPPTLEIGELWYVVSTQLMFRWNGLNWDNIPYITNPTDPTMPAVDQAWFNTTNSTWSIWDGAMWNSVDPIDSSSDPFAIPNGTMWFDTTNNILNERSGVSWIVTPFSTVKFAPLKGDLWFNTTTNTLMEWNGSSWVTGTPLAFSFIERGNIVIESNFSGSNACVMILIPDGSISGRSTAVLATGEADLEYEGLQHDWLQYGLYEDQPLFPTTVSTDQFLWDFLNPASRITRQVYGTDGVSCTPSYDEVGCGTDGSVDERRELAEFIRIQLGYPVVDVELTPQMINTSIDLALQTIRSRSSIAYTRGFFFLDVQGGQQKYTLKDKTVGFNKIVTVMSAYRFTSAFLSTAHGSGVYGQVVLQHLYNMGTFDLLSFHLVAQYVEQMEHLFATRLTYHWEESNRELAFYNSFAANEKVLLDVTLERTEQDIFKDRWIKTWIENFALAESKQMLSQIRGKYASLPGAGGGVALNAADLANEAATAKEELYQQIDDYIVNDAEDIGMQSQFIIG